MKPVFIVALLAFVAIYGYFANLFAVVHLATDAGAITGMFILRIVGIFLVPLGTVLGFV